MIFRITKFTTFIVPVICIILLLSGCNTNNPSPVSAPPVNTVTAETTDKGIAVSDAPVATTIPYADLAEIAKSKVSDLSEYDKLQNIIDLLPPITSEKAGQFIQNRFTTQTDSLPNRVILFYEPMGADENLNIDTTYSLCKAENNAAILMAYVDNLEKVTLRFRLQASFDQPDLPLSVEWSHYPESVSFTREQLSKKSFKGEDFKVLGENAAYFNQLLAENAKNKEMDNVQFMPGPDYYAIGESYKVFMPQLWLDNVILQEPDGKDQKLDGMITDYRMEFKPKYFNYSISTIATLYLFQADNWSKEYENDLTYKKLGNCDDSVFALKLEDDTVNSEDKALTDLLERLRSKANQSDFQSNFKAQKTLRP